MPSSVILGMRYVPEMRELIIAFRGGRGIYRYFDVPMEEWQEFRESGSKGTYLNEVFKTKNHRYEKVVDGSLLKMEGRQRDSSEDDRAKLLEWGETWAIPK